MLNSIRGRLTLLVGAILLPSLVLATVVIFQAYRNEHAAVGERLLVTARAIASIVDGEVGKAHEILDALAASEAAQGRHLARLDAMARRALARGDRWFVLMDRDGTQRVNTRVPPGTPLPKMIDLEAEFTAAIERGEAYVSNLRDGPVAQSLVVHISHPEVREGRVIGTHTVALLPATLARTLDLERFTAGGVIAITDRTGRIITRSMNADRFVGRTVTPDLVTMIKEGREGVQDSVTLEKVPVVSVLVRAQCGWSVAIGAPKAQLYAPARRLLYWGIFSALLVGAVASAMAFWIGRDVVREMEALTVDADTLGRGELPPTRLRRLDEVKIVGTAMQRAATTLLRRTQTLELMNRVNTSLVAERDLEKIVQAVTDAGREGCGAAFGAFFYNVENAAGESYTLFTLSGAPREDFARFGMPRNTPVFTPTFSGEGTVRVDDITADPRYGKMAPHHGMPAGHLPVRSYLAVPVKSRAGDVIGGLFFGHPQPGIFTAEGQTLVEGLAAEAAVAIDNAKLYQSLSRELEAKSRAEASLREAQARLHQHAQELERQVEARTQSLREAMAQMEEFSYTVSHDLRSPLRTIRSFAAMIEEDYGSKLDEAGKDYLARIIRGAARMDQLTTDVLNYSKIARAQVVLAPTDVAQLASAIVELYPELQPPAHVTLQPPLLPVLAHEPSLRQCLTNLLVNAAKFVRPGDTPRITVRTEARGSRVRIWVDDNGIGIPEKHRAKLFQIFERAATAKNYEGTGVGLAIVRKAAEKMGGTCGVESDGETGSHFWIELAGVAGE